MQLGRPLLDALERMHYGGLLLSGAGEVVMLNSTAERYLREQLDPADLRGGNSGWAKALRRVMGNRITRSAEHADFWIPVSSEIDRPLFLYSRRISEGGEQPPLTLVILLDLNDAPEPSSAVLQKMFGLTAAETSLAIQLTRGGSLAEIARAQGISITTARTQLSSIFAKTNTSRQAELVALLARISILP